jgi:hypothetical protein
MNTRIARNPWHAIWRTATGDGLLAGLLAAIAASLLVTLWLPQMPDADPVAYARWLSDVQASLGRATDTIQALGLLSITRSFGFRSLLALLAATLLLRVVECVDYLFSPTERRPWTAWFPALAQVGALLILLGQLLAFLWGWQVKGLLIHADERVTVPGTQSWVAASGSPSKVTHSPGTVVFVEGYEPGAQVTVRTGSGQSLGLRRTPQSEPVTQLTLALDEEQFFAVPEAELVVQLASHPDESGTETYAVHTRIYRSPPGRAETAQVIRGSGEVTVDDVTLYISSVPFTRITVTRNPGLLPTGSGLVLTVVGIVGSVARRRRDTTVVDEER